MAEVEQTHRHALENREQLHEHAIRSRNIGLAEAELKGEIKARTLGQTSAFAMGLVALLAGSALMLNGVEAAGIATFFGSLGVLAAVYIYTKHADLKQRELQFQREKEEAQATETAKKEEERQADHYAKQGKLPFR